MTVDGAAWMLLAAALVGVLLSRCCLGTWSLTRTDLQDAAVVLALGGGLGAYGVWLLLRG